MQFRLMNMSTYDLHIIFTLTNINITLTNMIMVFLSRFLITIFTGKDPSDLLKGHVTLDPNGSRTTKLSWAL